MGSNWQSQKTDEKLENARAKGCHGRPLTVLQYALVIMKVVRVHARVHVDARRDGTIMEVIMERTMVRKEQKS